MGNKSSSSDRRASHGHGALHAEESRRLTTFLEEKRSNSQGKKFTSAEIYELWSDILTPRLLESYMDYVLKTPSGKKEEISLDQFISLYIKIIRGSSDEKAHTIAAIIHPKGDKGDLHQFSYSALCKYFSDLMESYFVGLKSKGNKAFNTWHTTDDSLLQSIDDVVNGVLTDCPRTQDEVEESAFEGWLHHCGLFNTLHAYVLGSMYNLIPNQDTNLIPFARFPPGMSKNRKLQLLDLPHIVYLNYLLPAEHRDLWRFLFSIDTHGESFSKFISCITNQGPVLVVLRTDNHQTFGGYISANLTLSPKWIGTESCFLFKLGSSVANFPATGYNQNFAYLNGSQTTLPNGLGMGGQYGYWGLWIDAEFGVGECSESCTTYKNYKMLDTKKKFRIRHMEVWGVGEPPPTAEELGERTAQKSNRSALDQDAAASAILEMSGKEMHSKGIREDLRVSKNKKPEG